MPRITVSDLQRRGAEIFDQLEETGKPVVIFRRGLPVAVLRPLKEDDIVLRDDIPASTGKEGKRHGKA